MNKYSPTGSSFPKGIKGRILVSKMNKSHEDISSWGLSFVNIKDDFNILDIGCGGGRNLQRFLDMSKNGLIYGIDISKISILKSRKLNKKAYKENRLKLINDDIKNFNSLDVSFDLISAFCTVKFLSNYENIFKNIYNMLKKNGVFLICDHGDYDLNFVKESLKKANFSSIEIYSKDSYKCILSRK